MLSVVQCLKNIASHFVIWFSSCLRKVYKFTPSYSRSRNLLPSLKDIATEYRILGCSFFSFSTLKISIQCFPAFIVPDKKPTVNFTFVLLYIILPFPLAPSRFSLHLCFPAFGYDVPRYVFLCIYLVRGSISWILWFVVSFTLETSWSLSLHIYLLFLSLLSSLIPITRVLALFDIIL